MPRMFQSLRSRRRLLAVGMLVALPLAVLLGISGCVSFSMTEAEISRKFLERELPEPDYRTAVSAAGPAVFYARYGDPEARPVVFLHGSPGSWDNFLSFFLDPGLRRDFLLLAPDRPGFGNTAPEKAVASLERQAAILAPVLRESSRPAILVGHSLAGPLAARMAADFPGAVAALVLVAPSISPGLESPRWYNRLADWPPVRALLPRPLRHSNDEIMPLRGELEALEPALRELALPVVVIQGGKDRLVPPANADYVEDVMTRARVDVRRYPELNHFIPWTRPELIRQAVVDLDKALTAATNP